MPNKDLVSAKFNMTFILFAVGLCSGIDRVFPLARTKFKTVEHDFVERTGVRFSYLVFSLFGRINTAV